jgi:hypothetical protein
MHFLAATATVLTLALTVSCAPVEIEPIISGVAKTAKQVIAQDAAAGAEKMLNSAAAHGHVEKPVAKIAEKPRSAWDDLQALIDEREAEEARIAWTSGA